MPRPTRIRGPLSYHVVAKCNNEEFLFNSGEQFLLYLKCLQKFKEEYRFEINNFTLMSNHVHLIITTSSHGEIDQIIHRVHLNFSKKYNGRYDRKGHFWKDRYRSPVIQDDFYGLVCMRYINRNPVRAGMVQKPECWPWSAYEFYAFGKAMPLISPLPSYLALSDDPLKRREIYRSFVEMKTDQEMEKKIFAGKLKSKSRRYERLFQQTYGELELMTRK